MPFSLDSVSDLPRYVQRDAYQTVLDDQSGYDYILLSEESGQWSEERSAVRRQDGRAFWLSDDSYFLQV